jgi:hypothetical protein
MEKFECHGPFSERELNTNEFLKVAVIEVQAGSPDLEGKREILRIY